ncbi:transposable element gene, partial [Prunus dulcis]
KNLYKNPVWELVPKPKDRKLVGCKWVFRKKEGLHEQDAMRFKTRLVAKRYSQKEGVDYNEIFSPVVKHTSIRLLLAMATQHDMEIEQMDVKTAFLHGDLKETIFMAQPEGFVEYGNENLVCQLRKSLYGLKQSPRQWYKRFDYFMLKINFRRCLYDCCVYYHVFQDGMIILLLLYVDDMLIACQDKSRIQDLKKMLSKEFDMKDLGAAQKILGMEIQRDRTTGRIWISQAKYIQKVLEKFNMQEAKVVSTPLAAHFNLSGQQCPKSEEEQQVMEKVPYANVVGCLMYAMVCTRPNIAQAISVVSRYMGNPGKQHWDAVKWILCYLKGVLGYVDADYAGDLDKRRSTSGYVFTCAGGPISWRALLQPITALSTTEAEYIALAEARKEAIWLSGLVSQMGITQDCVKLKCDSQNCQNYAV